MGFGVWDLGFEVWFIKNRSRFRYRIQGFLC